MTLFRDQRIRINAELRIYVRSRICPVRMVYAFIIAPSADPILAVTEQVKTEDVSCITHFPAILFKPPAYLPFLCAILVSVLPSAGLTYGVGSHQTQ